MFKKFLIMLLFSYGAFSKENESNYFSDSKESLSQEEKRTNRQSEALIVRLGEVNQQFEKFKKRVKEIQEKYGEVWLVVCASLYTPDERIRFKDPRWIFWDYSRFGEDNGVNQDGRIALDGDAYKIENWNEVSKNLEGIFTKVAWDFQEPDWKVFLDPIKRILGKKGTIQINPYNLEFVKTLKDDFSFAKTSADDTVISYRANGEKRCDWLFRKYHDRFLNFMKSDSLSLKYLGIGTNGVPVLCEDSEDYKKINEECRLKLIDEFGAPNDWQKNWEAEAKWFSPKTKEEKKSIRNTKSEYQKKLTANLEQCKSARDDYYKEHENIIDKEALDFLVMLEKEWNPPKYTAFDIDNDTLEKNEFIVLIRK